MPATRSAGRSIPHGVGAKTVQPTWTRRPARVRATRRSGGVGRRHGGDLMRCGRVPFRFRFFDTPLRATSLGCAAMVRARLPVALLFCYFSVFRGVPPRLITTTMIFFFFEPIHLMLCTKRDGTSCDDVPYFTVCRFLRLRTQKPVYARGYVYAPTVYTHYRSRKRTYPRIRTLGCVYARTCVYTPTPAYKHVCVHAASGAYTQRRDERHGTT